jgi:hypothetical protein
MFSNYFKMEASEVKDVFGNFVKEHYLPFICSAFKAEIFTPAKLIFIAIQIRQARNRR